MRILNVKIARRFLICVIGLTLGAILLNYLHSWQRRERDVKNPPPILGSDVKRSVDAIQYFDYYKGGILRFKINARRLLVTNKNLLEGIEAYDFNPDGSVRNEIRSQRAEYDQERKIADFSGDVRLLINKKIELRMESLHYDLNSGIGTTPDLMRFDSAQMRGTARGVRFDQQQQAITLDSDVDITIIHRRGQRTIEDQPEMLRATARRAYCSQMAGRILFEGNARIDSDEQALSGEHIEAILDPSQKGLRSLTASGNSIYKANTEDEMQALSGDSMVFSISKIGTLEKIAVTGQASFSSASSDRQQDLKAHEIEMNFDAKELPTQIGARTGIRFDIKRGMDHTLISGDLLTAVFVEGTKNLRTIHIKGIPRDSESQAKMQTTAPNSNGGELQADEIRVNFRETDGRSVLEKLRAEGSARYIVRQAGKGDNSEPSRSLGASVLEMIGSSNGNYFESGSALGKIVISEGSNDSATRPQMKQLTADRANFGFYPGSNALKDLDADGNVQIAYEKKNGAARNSAVEKFRTTSDQMRAAFGFQDGKAVAQSVVQWGRFTYNDGMQSAAAGRCDYDAVKGVLVLSEVPEVSDKEKFTTGNRIEYDQNRKLLSVHGPVYSRFGSQPGGESFFGSSSSSSPGIIKAEEMVYWVDPGLARYSGRVHLLSENQDLQTDRLEISDGSERVEAQGSVRHTLSGQESSRITSAPANNPQKTARELLTTIQSSAMTYLKENNRVRYSGKVTLRSRELDLSSDELDAVPDADIKRIEHATARGNVVVHAGGRFCKGDVADYSLDSGKFVVTGKPAEAFDPDKGRSYARRLTSSTADDTILLEK